MLKNQPFYKIGDTNSAKDFKKKNSMEFNAQNNIHI